MYTPDQKPKMQGDWSFSEDGKERTLIAKDAAGKDVLMALGQKGVGAIYLGNVSTSFALKGAGNQTNGELQRTGIYLNENGSAGTIQHIDLTI